MEYVPLLLALVALVVAVLARMRAAGMQSAIEETARSARRMIENQAEEQAAAIVTLRRQLAAVARGETITDDMIEEGRLWRDVDAQSAAELLDAEPPHVLDVRTPQETAGGVLPGAQLIPIDQLEGRLDEVPRDGRTTLVYCAGGGRSAAACEFLSQQGFSNLLNLAGGISSWSGPTEKPQSS